MRQPGARPVGPQMREPILRMARSGRATMAGVFVGGRSRRMNGTPKGLLQPPSTNRTLVECLVLELRQAGFEEIVLVGRHPAYSRLDLPVVADSTRGAGPMAGLLGLVEQAARFEAEHVVAVACDMPRLTSALLGRLSSAAPDADVVAPFRERWEPFCARYRVAAVLPYLRGWISAGNTRLARLFEEPGLRRAFLRLDALECACLDDWDCPDDLPAGVTYQGIPVD